MFSSLINSGAGVGVVPVTAAPVVGGSVVPVMFVPIAVGRAVVGAAVAVVVTVVFTVVFTVRVVGFGDVPVVGPGVGVADGADVVGGGVVTDVFGVTAVAADVVGGTVVPYVVGGTVVSDVVVFTIDSR